MSSGNIRNTRDSFLKFLADNLPANSIHPVRRVKGKPQLDSLQLSRINVTYHDATYSVKQPSTQFVTLDILHDDELAALDLEEATVSLLQLGAATPLIDYSTATSSGAWGTSKWGEDWGDPGPTQVSNTRIFWNPDSIKFRTVMSDDYFHRTAVLELFVRYV